MKQLMSHNHTPEEINIRCDEMLTAARTANQYLTKEEEDELIGNFYMDAMCESFSSDREMAEFVLNALPKIKG